MLGWVGGDGSRATNGFGVDIFDMGLVSETPVDDDIKVGSLIGSEKVDVGKGNGGEEWCVYRWKGWLDTY